MIIKFTVSSECGKFRKQNEDNVTAIINKYGMILGVLCDGMGGHFGGRIASQLTIDLVKKEFLAMNFPIELDIIAKEDIIDWCQNIVTSISDSIQKYAAANPDFEDMGTTFVAALFFRDKIYVLNIGDSRAYYANKLTIQQITEDHNIRNYLKKNSDPDVKMMGPEHALTSALGPKKIYKLDLFTLDIVEGYIFLASDGLYNFVTENFIIGTLSRPITLKEKAENLIQNANSRSNDNLSIVLFEIINFEGKEPDAWSGNN